MATLHRQSRTTRPQRNSAVDIPRIADRHPLQELSDRYPLRRPPGARPPVILKPQRPRRGFKPQLLLGGTLRLYPRAAG